jgi:predicted TIM-barrel fold metal-dependent hydrolase
MMDAAHTLLFTTDYPHWDSDEPDFIFRSVSEDVRQRIYRENALETYTRMTVPHPAAQPARA